MSISFNDITIIAAMEENTMGRETVLFKNEEKIDAKGAASFLRQLADKIEEGSVIFKRGKETVKLEIPSRVELEIKAEKEVGKKKTKKKLEVEIEWVVGEEDKGAFTLD